MSCNDAMAVKDRIWLVNCPKWLAVTPHRFKRFRNAARQELLQQGQHSRKGSGSVNQIAMVATANIRSQKPFIAAFSPVCINRLSHQFTSVCESQNPEEEKRD